MQIDLFTFITNNCTEYAELLYKSCELFKSRKHTINYRAIESINCNYWPKEWEHVKKTLDYNHGSISHAIAIQEALRNIESEYCIIMDCDIAFLYPDWDSIIIKKLERHDAFGGGYSDYKTAKFFNFPSPHLFCFKTKLLEDVFFDFMPLLEGVNVRRYSIETKSDKQIYQKGPSSFIKCDTGWKIPGLFQSAKKTSSTMKMIYHRWGLMPFKGDTQKEVCNEYPMQQSEWHYNKKVFATHKQLATTHHLSSKHGRIWQDRINRYIKKEYGLAL